MIDKIMKQLYEISLDSFQKKNRLPILAYFLIVRKPAKVHFILLVM
jgi:hypothetical protein